MHGWNVRRVVGAMVCTLAVSGCASTPYQPMGFRGGYQDESLGDGTYLVTVQVNAYTDASTAYRYFHRRSADLCRERGFSSYVVLDSDRSSKKMISDVGGGDLVVVEKARVFGRIQCRPSPS